MTARNLSFNCVSFITTSYSSEVGSDLIRSMCDIVSVVLNNTVFLMGGC